MSDPNVSELIADLREQILYLQELGVDSFDVELPDAKLQIASADSDKREVDSLQLAAPAVFEKAPPPSNIELPR